MKLCDAEIERKTGYLFARGHLSIDAENEFLIVPAHDRLLLLQETREDLSFVPIVTIERNEHGFCEATEQGAFRLHFRSVCVEELAKVSILYGSQTHVRRGRGIGSLNWGTPSKSAPMQSYELSVEDVGDGRLRLSVSGLFSSNENGIVRKFAIEASIAWEGLLVRGCEARCRDQGTIVQESPKPFRDPRNLEDLLIDSSFAQPYVDGELISTPEPVFPRRRKTTRLGFLSVSFNEHQIIFVDASPRILASGFATCSSHSRRLEITTLSYRGLDWELWRRGSVSMELDGDGLGKLSYQGSYEMERDLGIMPWISQDLKTLTLNARLVRNGLQVAAEGDVNDFDFDVYPSLRKAPYNEQKPVRTYALRATLPWALLIVRGFRCAQRMDEFWS